MICTTCGSELEEQWSVCPNCGTPKKEIIEPEENIVAPQETIIPQEIDIFVEFERMSKQNIVAPQETIIPQKIDPFVEFERAGRQSIVKVSNEKVSKKKKSTKEKIHIVIFIFSLLIAGAGIGYMMATYIQIMPLNTDIGELQDDYDNLIQDYEDLFSDYEALRHAFEDPLINPDVPTYNEFNNWLCNVDDTDEGSYTSVWMCGDFSAMLMTRAKTMNWRMRICTMVYSFSGDSGYGVSNMFGEFAHAFCFIECSDGYIYYVEPQTDIIWYFGVGIHFSLFTYYSGFNILGGTVWYGQGTFWTNYYNYFG